MLSTCATLINAGLDMSDYGPSHAVKGPGAVAKSLTGMQTR
jgi:hypothetical protein